MKLIEVTELIPGNFVPRNYCFSNQKLLYQLRRILLILLVLFLSRDVIAQLTAGGNPAPCAAMTSYTNNSPNDPIYYYQNGQLGSLTATPPSGTPGWAFAWAKYNAGSWVTLITQNNLPSSTLNNLQQGAYRVTITDGTGTIVGCYRAWILQILQEPLVSIAPITGDCDGPITLSATIQNPQVTPYHNLPPDPMLINAQTQITVCFSANHTYVSDLAYHLRGPASCGSPDILLAPSPGICNQGDNLNNLCFTNQAAPNFMVCNPAMPTPLTGTFDSYGAGNTPINWSALYGCDATAAGWRVELWDCVGGDQGSMTMGRVTFVGTSVCGEQQTITYQSPTGFSAPIAVTSCSSSSAAGYAVTNPVPVNINCTFGYQWASNPPIVIPNATSSLNIPISTLTSPSGGTLPWQSIDFTLSLTSPCTGLLNCLGSGKLDSESFTFETEDETVIDPPGSVCISGSSFNMTSTPSAGTWSGTGITSGTVGTFDPVVAGIGQHEVFFVPTDPCFNDTSIIVTVDDLPILVINSPNGFCIDGSAYQFTSPTPGGTWSGTAITSAGLFTPSTAGLGAHTITYDVGGSCPVSTTKSITVFALPIISAGNDATICNGSATQLQGTGGVSYSWTPTTGIPNPSVAAPFATPPSNNFTYSVVGTDANGCSNSDSVTLTFFAGPQVTASEDPAIICPGTATPLSAQGTTASGAAGSYMWTPSTGVTGASSATPSVAPYQTTTYTVTFTDNCGLTATDQVLVTTELFHSVTLPTTAQFCEDADILLTAAVTGTSPTLQWTSNVSGFDNTSYTTSSLLINQPGAYTLTVTSPMGCTHADMTIVSEVPLPNPYMPSPVNLCPNKTVTLNAGNNWNQVLWSNNSSNPSITVSQPGVYTALVTHNGCSNSASVTVNLVEMPPVNLGPDISICDGTLATLSIPVSGTWSTGANTSSIQVTTAGTYSVSVNISSCIATDTIIVRIKPRPIANLPAQVIGCLEGTAAINAANPVNAYYLWSTGETTPMIEVSEFGTYTVTTYNDCGTASDSVHAYFQDCTYAIYIPNTFTPDNDGINEVWNLTTYNIKKLTLRIFNRWGDPIFITNDLNPIWTGEVNSGDYYARDGIYSFHMTYETVNGELGERSGNIILLR